MLIMCVKRSEEYTFDFLHVCENNLKFCSFIISIYKIFKITLFDFPKFVLKYSFHRRKMTKKKFRLCCSRRMNYVFDLLVFLCLLVHYYDYTPNNNIT